MHNQRAGTIISCMSPQNGKRVASQQSTLNSSQQLYITTLSNSKLPPKIDNARLKQFQKLLSSYKPGKSPLDNRTLSNRNSINEQSISKVSQTGVSEQILRLVNSVTPQKNDSICKSGIIKSKKQIQQFLTNDKFNMYSSLQCHKSDNIILNIEQDNQISQLRRVYKKVKLKLDQYEFERQNLLIQNNNLKGRIKELENQLDQFR